MYKVLLFYFSPEYFTKLCNWEKDLLKKKKSIELKYSYREMNTREISSVSILLTIYGVRFEVLTAVDERLQPSRTYQFPCAALSLRCNNCVRDTSQCFTVHPNVASSE